MKSISVIDYGLGNLFNLVTALRVVGADVNVIARPDEVARADRVILPGVGAFGPGMEVLRSRSLDVAIRGFVASGKPLLGICLGMQFLMTESEENGVHPGFDFIRGRVVRFSTQRDGMRLCKVPQMSWNSLSPNPNSSIRWDRSVLREISPGTDMYFVHSYFAETTSQEHTIAFSEYGEQRYAAVVGHENVSGAQFHPERSAVDGLRLLTNFVES